MKIQEGVRDAAWLAMRNRTQIEKSKVCGCYYCGHIFSPEEIKEYTDDKQTVLCPKCCVDAVLGSSHNVPINIEYLEKVHRYWF